VFVKIVLVGSADYVVMPEPELTFRTLRAKLPPGVVKMIYKSCSRLSTLYFVILISQTSHCISSSPSIPKSKQQT